MGVLLHLLSGVALLVWGTNIVKVGILRVYGANLRHVLSASISNRFTAFSPAWALPAWSRAAMRPRSSSVLSSARA